MTDDQVFGFIFLLGSLWCVYTFRSYSSPWRQLAKFYKTRRTPHPHPYSCIFPFQSIQFGSRYYKSVINIGISDRGLYLAIPIPLNLLVLFNPPLLIPWASIQTIRQIGGFLSGERYEISVKCEARNEDSIAFLVSGDPIKHAKAVLAGRY
ncbi:MAG: hypothetical protein SFY66_10890 [Oculatellaceae cyanobacterium bins.114]|nr:hypothetical protein [Oculatellaceae cyanobacterium bins.114]